MYDILYSVHVAASCSCRSGSSMQLCFLGHECMMHGSVFSHKCALFWIMGRVYDLIIGTAL